MAQLTNDRFTLYRSGIPSNKLIIKFPNGKKKKRCDGYEKRKRFKILIY
jgi:hypothetical protein